MLFNSYQFMVFFPVVLLIYYVIPRKLRMYWLLVASYYFYMGWNAKYAVLIAISTVVTFASGILMERLGRKRWIVAASLVINLGILFFFKYFNFVWTSLAAVLDAAGIRMTEKTIDVLLPVGISFYTFQALGYTIDVYRGTVPAEKNLFRYALFVSFFPQLVAGPIERSSSLLRQVDHVEDLKLWNVDRITDGAILMLWGFFQKLVIADRAAILVDLVYDGYKGFGSFELILATVLFAVQIYCDFSSYSTIAVGAAKIMGFELMENFDTPYFAGSIREFWRRWHVSLSGWFRDYLYIPLGGSRCSRAKKYRNIMITFLVSGLWHGAGWTYVIWGGLHGAYQVAGDMLAGVRGSLWKRLGTREDSFSFRLGKVLVTFVLVDFAWIFFRADSLAQAAGVIGRIFTGWDPWTLFDGTLYQLGLAVQEMHILAAGIGILFLADLTRLRTGRRIEGLLKNEMLWFRWGVLLILLFMTIILGIYGPGFDAKAFIYFQF